MENEITELKIKLIELEQKVKILSDKENENDELWYKDQPIKVNSQSRYLCDKNHFYTNGRTSNFNDFITVGEFISLKVKPDYNAKNIINWIPNNGVIPSVIGNAKYCVVAIRRDGVVLYKGNVNQLNWIISNIKLDIMHYCIITKPIKI